MITYRRDKGVPLTVEEMDGNFEDLDVGKVDKVVGMGLSGNDFSDALLTKLNSLTEAKFVDGADPLDAVYMDGNVGIGRTDPKTKLHVNGAVTGEYFRVTDGLNTVYGNYALDHIKNGLRNIALGKYSLGMTDDGDDNIGLGIEALYNNQTGSRSVAIGNKSFQRNAVGNGNVGLGHRSGYWETGNDKLYIDNSDTSSPLIWGDFGINALKFNITNLNFSTLPTSATGLVNGDIYSVTYADLDKIDAKHRVLIEVQGL